MVTAFQKQLVLLVEKNQTQIQKVCLRRPPGPILTKQSKLTLMIRCIIDYGNRGCSNFSRPSSRPLSAATSSHSQSQMTLNQLGFFDKMTAAEQSNLQAMFARSLLFTGNIPYSVVALQFPRCSSQRAFCTFLLGHAGWCMQRGQFLSITSVNKKSVCDKLRSWAILT